jgi:hypothetical protein
LESPEYGIESLGFITGGEFLDWMSYFLALKYEICIMEIAS